MKLITSAEMKALDRQATEQAGILSTALMLNAAAHIVDTAKSIMGNNPRVAVFCGSGNNGGDGIAAAGILLEEGHEVQVFLVTGREKMSEDAQEMEGRLIEAGGSLSSFNPECPDMIAYAASCGVIIDAIFGIGLNAELRGKPLAAVKLINRLGVPVLSVDIATGVEADTGKIFGVAVQAFCTVTFTLPKPGNFIGKGGNASGRVKVVDIGIPKTLIDRVHSQSYIITQANVSLPPRRRDLHKGAAGKLLLIGGSVGYTGALPLAAFGALRTGAGLVFMGVPESIYAITAVNALEAMPFPLPCTRGRLNMRALPIILNHMAGCDALLIGPGLGQGEETEALVAALVRASKIPVILDADGLNAISQNIHVLDEARAPIILTPHDGEFARLGGDLTHGHRLQEARAFSNRWGCSLVLKGPGTITAFPEGTVCVNTTGNPGMATGGSGDVLSGMITALVGQGLPFSKAVYISVWAHGRAGDLAASRLGQYSMLPSDMLDDLPEVLQSIVR